MALLYTKTHRGWVVSILHTLRRFSADSFNITYLQKIFSGYSFTNLGNWTLIKGHQASAQKGTKISLPINSKQSSVIKIIVLLYKATNLTWGNGVGFWEIKLLKRPKTWSREKLRTQVIKSCCNSCT